LIRLNSRVGRRKKVMKIKIKIGIIGYLPFYFDRKFIKKWKSDVFEIVGDIEEYNFNKKADMTSWGYSDSIMEKVLPETIDADFFIGVIYVPIEDNYYARRLSSNRIILSYFEIYNFLKQEHIPIENFLLRAIYEYILVYKTFRNIPSNESGIRIPYLHDASRGCIFDMNGQKSNVVYSLDCPIICDKCTEKIKDNRVEYNYIELVKKEIRRIKKECFYRIAEFIKKRPGISLMLSASLGILLNLIASVIYSLIKSGKSWF
jgi:hypothetical protein